MASSSILPGSVGAKLLVSQWSKEIRISATEEGVIHPDIPEYGAEKIGDTGYVRVLPAVTMRTATGSTELGPESLTWETGTVLRVSFTPTIKYAAVEIPESLTAKLLDADNTATRNGYRKAMVAGMDEAKDIGAAALATSVLTIKGPGNMDKAQLLDCKKTLRLNAKNHFKNGSLVHFKYHPSQMNYVESITEIMNADARGDADNPNVRGVVVSAWGLTLAETANIAFSGGNYWNMMFLETAFAKGSNELPRVKGPIDAGLTDRFFAYEEFGFVDVFDNDCVIFKSA